MIKSSQGLRGEDLLRLQGKPLTENSLPGLSLDLRTPVLAGTPPKPTIRAEPGSVVTNGTQVAISCEGTTEALEYYLNKCGQKDPWWRQTPLHPRIKAHFLIPSIDWQHAGRYDCYYRTHFGWSEHSDSLELVVTGSSVDNSTTPTGSNSRAGLGGYQMILIGVSVVFFLLFLLIFLLLRWRCQHKCRKEVQSEITDIQLPEDSEEPVPRERGPQKRSCPATAIKKEIKYASLKFPQPKSSMELYSLNPPNEDPLKEMYTQGKPSRLGRAGATSPPSTLSSELLNSKNRESEEDRDEQRGFCV